MNIGIVLAGGNGSRFGSAVPKQYLLLNNTEVIAYSIKALKESRLIDKIIVMVENEYFDYITKKFEVSVAQSGSTRNETISKSLEFISNKFKCNKVIFLDAARPMVTSDIVNDYITKLNEFDAVITGQKIIDNLGSKKEFSINRDDYYLIQAPEAYNFDILNDNFKHNSLITSANQHLPSTAKIFINFSFFYNVKITYEHDISICEMLINSK